VFGRFLCAFFDLAPHSPLRTTSALLSVRSLANLTVLSVVEAFGTDRILFGSHPALPLLEIATHTLAKTSLAQSIPSGEWYATARRCLAQLGEGQEAITAVMGQNAAKVYDLSRTLPPPASLVAAAGGEPQVLQHESMEEIMAKLKINRSSDWVAQWK
jgi:hypothetical protein